MEISKFRVSMAELNETEFTKSIDQLCGLATSINVFKTRFDELQKHVDFINKAMDTKFNNQNPHQQEKAESLELPPAIIPETTSHQTPIATEKVTVLKAPQTVPTETTEKDGKSSKRPELHYLCEMMCSRGLRKYVVSHLSEIQSARQEAISALKSAPRPAKLVLETVGRFFLQGARAYTKDSPMITSRQASVLMLELFLTVIGESEREIEIEKLVKQEADNNAIAWKERLVSEGGVCKACEIDCRGLLLFIACFGIPSGFKDDDVRDLIRGSNLKEIGHLLRGSCVLASKIPDIIENMKENGMHVEAVDVVYSFGIEDEFSPQKILFSFLRESKETWKRAKRDALTPLKKEATEKHLAALQSVIKCSEDKKIDPAKLLPGWRIKDTIVKLEKSIADLNKHLIKNKMMPKRKACETESSNEWNSQEMKRRRFTANGATLNGSSMMTSPNDLRLHDPRAAYYANGKSSYDGLTPNLLDGGFCGYINSHPSVSAASHVYNTRPLPDVLGSTVGGRSSVNSVGVNVSMSPGIVTLPNGSFTGGVHGETSVDKFDHMTHPNGSSYGWHRAGDAPYNDRVIGQSYTGQPAASVLGSLYRPLQSMEQFSSLLDPSSISSGNHNPSSDLYSFVDTVI